MYPSKPFSLFVALASAVAPAASLGRRQDDDVSIQTTFLIDSSCSEENKIDIEQAHRDGVEFAKAALESCHDDLTTSAPCLKMNTRAAIDYWGPKRADEQAKIFYTLYRASVAESGWGLSDWWYDRYVNVTCSDPTGGCDPNTPAYVPKRNTGRYPIINYCPAFFKNLTSHEEQWKKIQDDQTGQKKLNIRNLRSRATTALHELLYIKGYPAEVCVDSTQALLNGEIVPTYKAGRAKLLAKRDIHRAAETNDNYVYFAMARWMEKQTGVYPEFPHAWDKNKSRKENEEIEKGQPGAQGLEAEAEIDDFDDGIDEKDEGVTADLYEVKEYPQWYWPVLDKTASTESAGVQEPEEELPTLSTPDVSTVVCHPKEDSEWFVFCARAFAMNGSRDREMPHGIKGEVETIAWDADCLINVKYLENWTDECTATKGEVFDHALVVLTACQDGGNVGGHVPFGVPNCPAEIQLVGKE